MTLSSTRGGYLFVTLSNNGATKQFRVNRLVLWGFTGLMEDDMDACHANGDHTDNRLMNLYWGTRVQNVHDQKIHGTVRVGSSKPLAKLTDDLVREARHLWDTGEYEVIDLANRYNVSGPTIWKAVTRRTWKHVE
jgi:hypothetical protein